MDTSRAKKVAAALAAVLRYAAEAEVAPAALGAAPDAPSPLPTAPPLWGLTGRQDAMLLRNLWQRRLSRSW